MARVILVDICAVLFGLGTWICVNGLWVELPLLVQKLPEAWNLPSYLTVVIQIANIAPLLYTILNSVWPAIITEKRSIYFVISLGTIVTLLTSIFWDSTSDVFGEHHSTGLLSLVLFLAMVDCSSRVLYLPFMSRFQEIYLMSFFIGEGLSGLVPSIFALIQGVGGNPECTLVNETESGGAIYKAETKPPRFTVEVFFYFLLAIVVTSGVVFHILNYNSLVKDALAVIPKMDGSITPSQASSRKDKKRQREAREDRRVGSSNMSELKRSQTGEKDISAALGAEFVTDSNDSFNHERLPKSLVIHVLIIQLFACGFANGVLPSISSYSCLPYGNVPYHLANTLSSMANPAVCLLLFVLPKPTRTSVTILFSAGICISTYAFVTAVKSPTPPLAGQVVGDVLIVLTWVLLGAILTYVKVSVAIILRSDGRRGLFWCGAITQLGSTIGAIITFFIVNYTDIFVPYYPCQSENELTSTTSASAFDRVLFPLDFMSNSTGFGIEPKFLYAAGLGSPAVMN